MDRDWLILDMNYLLWREFFGAGNRDARYTVTHAIDRIHELMDQFKTTSIVATFDCPPYRRSELLPGYKATRHDGDDAETATAKSLLYGMVNELRNKMPEWGFPTRYKLGYESDDVMWVASRMIAANDRAVLITEDGDLYQALTPRVAIYHPRREMFVTDHKFELDYGIPPSCWNEVKALTGCGTDEVPGLHGVGEQTALRYVRQSGRGPLRKKADIAAFMQTPRYHQNLELVTIPFPGLKLEPFEYTPLVPNVRDRVADWLGLTTRRGVRT